MWVCIRVYKCIGHYVRKSMCFHACTWCRFCVYTWMYAHTTTMSICVCSRVLANVCACECFVMCSVRDVWSCVSLRVSKCLCLWGCVCMCVCRHVCICVCMCVYQGIYVCILVSVWFDVWKGSRLCAVAWGILYL